MKLPKYAIENHQFTLVMVVLLVLSGVVSLITMPRSEDPPVSPAASSVIVIYPGASPADIEQLIVEPIEEVLNELENIKIITSQSADNIADIQIEFMGGSDPDEKYSEVVQKVNSIRDHMPADILSLDIFKWSVSNVAIAQIALISDTDAFPVLEDEAKRLEKMLEKVTGVRNVDLHAIPEKKVYVAVDLAKLALYRIPLTRIMGALQDANANIPGGYVHIGRKRLSIKTSGSYRSLQEIQNTVVHSEKGKPVFLREVADVTFGLEDNDYLARVDGKRAVFITMTQKEKTNIFWISRDAKEVIERFRETLPNSIELAVVFDQSESVSRRVSGFFGNLFFGILMVGLIVFSAVGFHAAIIVMLAIPFSILIGIGFVDMSQYGLQQMSIAGMVIALGLLVDNAIVVTENVTRFMKMGYSRVDSAVLGTSQVGWAVISATATTVLAFVPIIMMQEMTGEFIRSMPVTVVYTLSASLLLSLTLTPYLSEKFIRVNNGYREMPLRRGLNYIIDHFYRRLLDFGLRRPFRLLMYVFSAFILSLVIAKLCIDVSVFPKAEKPLFYINVNCPEDTRIGHTDEVVRRVESEVRRLPGVKHIISNVGFSNPPLYYNMMRERNKASHGQVVVLLEKYQIRAFENMLGVLRRKFKKYPGVKIEVKELEQGPPVEAPIAIKILGEKIDVLRNIADDVEKIIASQEGTVNVRNPISVTKSDLQVKINREKAGLLGVPLSEIDRTVRAALTGISITEFRDDNGEKSDIVIRLPIQNKPVLSDFNRIYVHSLSGAAIPLNHVARIEFSSSPLEIEHYRLERCVTVTSDVLRGYSVAMLTREIVRRLDKYPWPKGYSMYVAGEQESRQDSFGGMLKAVVIAMIAIFGVLVLQFRSYLQPVIVFVAIPLAIIGSILALLITGNTFSFTAFVGITSLVGIVVNNSIILVDYTNQLRREGKETEEALKEAGETRFIPIILTTLTTVGGLFPLTVVGGTIWAPMGWTIIGGLMVSTFLTLVVVPVLYKLLSPQMIMNNNQNT